MWTFAPAALPPPPPAVLRRDAPPPRVAERLRDVRRLCVLPAPPPADAAAAAAATDADAAPPCREALDELEREVAHERYLHARTLLRMRCLLGVDLCDGERSV